MIGCLWTLVRKQPIIALYFESENELKFYNLENWQDLHRFKKRIHPGSVGLLVLKIKSLNLCYVINHAIFDLFHAVKLNLSTVPFGSAVS